jgi:cellulase
MRNISSLAALFGVFVAINGHAHIQSWSVGGVAVPGFEFWTHKNTNKLNSSWFSENGENGFVSSKLINGLDIICHKAARPGSTHTRVAAGMNLIVY